MSKLFLLSFLVLSIVTITAAIPSHEERDIQSILENVGSVMETIGTELHKILDVLGSKLGEYHTKIVDHLKELTNKVKDLVQQGKEKLPQLKQDVLNKITELQKTIDDARNSGDIGVIAKGILGMAKDALRVLEGAINLIPTPSTTEKRNLSEIGDNIKEYFEKVSEYLHNVLEKVGGKIGEMKEKIQKAVQELKEKVQELINAGKEKLPEIKKDILEKINELKTHISEAAKKPDLSLLQRIILTTAGKFIEILENSVEKVDVGDVEERDLTSVMENIKAFLEKTTAKVQELLGSIGDHFAEVKEKIKNKIEELKEKIKELISKGKEKLPEVKEDIIKKIQDLKQILDDLLAKEGISVFESVMVKGAQAVLEYVEKVVKGIELPTSEKRDINSALETIKDAIGAAVTQVMNAINHIGEKLGVFKDKISEKVNQLKEKINELIQKGKEKFPEVKQELLDRIKDLKNTIDEAANQPDLWFWQETLLKIAHDGLTLLENTVSKINVE